MTLNYSTIKSELTQEALNEYLAALDTCAVLNAHERDQEYPTLAPSKPDTFEVVSGKKYIKILQHHHSGGHSSGSVHAFIERSTGCLIKPASFKAPQKEGDGLAVRFHLSDPESREFICDQLKSKAHLIHGSYLYKDWTP